MRVAQPGNRRLSRPRSSYRKIWRLISSRSVARMLPPVKESSRYVATLLAFIAAAFVLSWCAVYSFWIAAHVFKSVQAVRTLDEIGAVILFPARMFFELAGNNVGPTTLLTNPLLYAAINASLLGILVYAACRQWIFKRKSGG
jgi:hypothetical protein